MLQCSHDIIVKIFHEKIEIVFKLRQLCVQQVMEEKI